MLISTAGSPHLLTDEHIRPHHRVVIDSGCLPQPDGTIASDVHPRATAIAQRITPVPGGVGPVEMAVLTSPHEVISMSPFSLVDASADPRTLLTYLDHHGTGPLAPVKARLLHLLGIRPGQQILDLGCGAGHDLELLARAGAVPIGIDVSAHMVRANRHRCPQSRLAQADAAALPFAAHTLDGCRIERVLQHVADPVAVIAEVKSVVRSAGTVVLFEPGWTSLTFDSPDPDTTGAVVRAVSAAIAQPAIGLQVRRLSLEAGFTVTACTPEAGDFTTWQALRQTTNLDRALRRVVAEGWSGDRERAVLGA
jgi:SAM-dependent methyltransferase